jgi:sugar fermentation stimulation protein A
VRFATPPVQGTLLRRYQRFLADVRLADGRVVVAHVANSGAMTACSAPGSPCFVTPAAGARRKLAWTLEIVVDGGVPVGVNTARANALAEEALCLGLVRLPDSTGPWSLRREVRLAAGTRIDFLVEDGRGPTWLEVKSVSWAEDGVALFPDAVSTRAARHLAELAARVRAGERAALLYLVQRGDARAVRAAGAVDPAYVAALAAARRAGVAVRALQVAVAPGGLVPWRELPVLP